MRILSLVSFSVLAACANTGRVNTPSINQLVASPDDYAGKTIQLTGYLWLHYEGDVLCTTEDLSVNRECIFLDYGLTRKPRFRRDAERREPGFVRLIGEWVVDRQPPSDLIFLRRADEYLRVQDLRVVRKGKRVSEAQ